VLALSKLWANVIVSEMQWGQISTSTRRKIALAERILYDLSLSLYIYTYVKREKEIYVLVNMRIYNRRHIHTHTYSNLVPPPTHPPTPPLPPSTPTY
jgi:hypothetical protein